MTSVIPTSAKLVLEFTPTCLDADRLERERSADIDRRADDLSSEIEGDRTPAQVIQIEQLKQERENLRSAVDTVRRIVPTPPTFYLSVPTALERDQLALRLAKFGVLGAADDQIQATFIDEMFSIDWGKGSDEANEVYPEEMAQLCDSVWRRQKVDAIVEARWQEREVQRLQDQMAGAPRRPAEAPPEPSVSRREKAKVKLIETGLIERSDRLKDLNARQQDLERLRREVAMRMHIMRVDGLETPLEREVVTNALPALQVQALRQEMQDRYGIEIADPAWEELFIYVNSLYSLSRDEEKNSDWPVRSSTGQSSSRETNTSPASSDGGSTESNIGRTPSGASDKTTDTSFSSTIESRDERASLAAESSSPTVVDC